MCWSHPKPWAKTIAGPSSRPETLTLCRRRTSTAAESRRPLRLRTDPQQRAYGLHVADAPEKMSHGPHMLDDARAYWLCAPGRGEIRPVALPEPGQGDVVVRTLRSGVSRGTESLVFRGGVPPRAPFQEGEFPGPVKYGYLNVGAVEQGPAELRGRTVFCLYPHQTAYVVPAGAVTVVPDDVPPARAVLAGTVETAVNALWDAAPLVGDRVAVVGAGMVGCCVARLLARFPAVEVTLVDVDPSRGGVAAALGAGFAQPDDAA